MLQLEGLEFDYEPYPIGVARPVIASDLYREMVEDYPPIELFEHTPGTGLKYVLSEKRRASHYHAYIASKPHWREFHRYIKSRDFVGYVLDSLVSKQIDIGLDCAVAPRRVILARTLAALFRGHSPANVERLRTRFQFSALPADGGFVQPHTDSPKKRITLIISIVGDSEWDPTRGGGTDVNRARSPEHAYNWRNQNLTFEDVETLKTYEFLPNQCVVLVKTFNSIHSVRPMQAPGSDALRRTLTINLEVEH
jgi:hypothetical protein